MLWVYVHFKYSHSYSVGMANTQHSLKISIVFAWFLVFALRRALPLCNTKCTKEQSVHRIKCTKHKVYKVFKCKVWCAQSTKNKVYDVNKVQSVQRTKSTMCLTHKLYKVYKAQSVQNANCGKYVVYEVYKL